MTFEERKEWLLLAIRDKRQADVLDAEFVEDFAQWTGAKITMPVWGAGWCPTLSKDLGKLYRQKYLDRRATGLSSGAWQPGFPKWVYSYRLARLGILHLQHRPRRPS